SNFNIMSKPQVGIIMGSESDLKIMNEAAEVLGHLGIEFELTVVSAHRTPQRMMDYAAIARERGIKVIIAGAGGAGHLTGMVATVALNSARNAGILAAQILGATDKTLAEKLYMYKKELQDKVENSIREIKIAGFRNDFD